MSYGVAIEALMWIVSASAGHRVADGAGFAVLRCERSSLRRFEFNLARHDWVQFNFRPIQFREGFFFSSSSSSSFCSSKRIISELWSLVKYMPILSSNQGFPSNTWIDCVEDDVAELYQTRSFFFSAWEWDWLNQWSINLNSSLVMKIVEHSQTSDGTAYLSTVRRIAQESLLLL